MAEGLFAPLVEETGTLLHSPEGTKFISTCRALPEFRDTSPASPKDEVNRSGDLGDDGDDKFDEDEVLDDEEPVTPAPSQVIEKIPDEDKRKPHVLKRAIFKILPFLEKGEHFDMVSS